MRKSLFFLLTTLLLSSCSKEPSQEDIVLNTAKAYYEQLLLQGDYKSFVACTSGFEDSIPSIYREQLEVSMKQFAARQKKDHQGIDSISMVKAKVDTVNSNGSNSIIANAFLTINYTDKSKEEIVVPMIRKGSVWYMR